MEGGGGCVVLVVLYIRHTQHYAYGSSQTVGPLRPIVQCSHVKADRIASRSLPTEDGLCFFLGNLALFILNMY